MNNQSEARLKKLQGQYALYYIIAFVLFIIMVFLYLSGVIDTIKVGQLAISSWMIVRIVFPLFVAVMIALTVSYYSKRSKVTQRVPIARR